MTNDANTDPVTVLQRTTATLPNPDFQVDRPVLKAALNRIRMGKPDFGNYIGFGAEEDLAHSTDST